jgi:hypothetical protein
MTVDLDSIQADIPVAAAIRRRRARRDLARRPASPPPAQYP